MYPTSYILMELMLNMQVSRLVTAVHMTVQECTNVFKALEKGPVKLIKWVKIAHSFLQSVSNQFTLSF